MAHTPDVVLMTPFTEPVDGSDNLSDYLSQRHLSAATQIANSSIVCIILGDGPSHVHRNICVPVTDRNQNGV